MTAIVYSIEFSCGVSVCAEHDAALARTIARVIHRHIRRAVEGRDAGQNLDTL